jgi:MFS family permease
LILAVFRVRSFRFQLPADLLTSWAFEMETLILGWYVMVQTGSVLLLTAFASLQFLGTLAAPMFGVLGDRLGGRLMLCAMRASYAVLGATMMGLALSGLLTPAWVFALATLIGVVRPNDLVMRNTLIGETIPPGHLMGALGMSRATADSARVAGALAGAGLSTLLGIGASYVFVTSFYLASLALTFGVARRPMLADPGAASDPSSTGPSPYPLPRGERGSRLPRGERGSQWRELKDGVAYVLRTPELLAFMWLAFLINLTAYPVSNGLLPYVARRVYMVDAAGLGFLVASFSLGGLLASMTVVMTGGSRSPERSTLVHTAIWYTLLLGFGHLGSFGAGLLTLFAAGFVQNVAMISMTGALLAATADRFRGRVMGVRMLAVYGLPLGLMAAGGLIEWVGYPLTISAFSVTGLLFTLLIGIRWRASIWRRRSRAGFAGATHSGGGSEGAVT